MRRRHDDWINATHILKAAGFDKPARTRILEREVQKEMHKKVQGGYGKYQGRIESRIQESISNFERHMGSARARRGSGSTQQRLREAPHHFRIHPWQYESSAGSKAYNSQAKAPKEACCSKMGQQ